MSERRFQRPVTRPHRPSAAGNDPVFGNAWSSLSSASVGMLPVYLLLATALLFTGAFIALDRLYAGQMLPNVSIQGLAVGGMRPAEAGAALRAHHGAWLRQPVLFTYGGQEFRPSLDELGVTLDMERTVADAYSTGRSASPLLSLRQYYTSWRYGIELPLYVAIDEPQLKRYLAGLGQRIDLAPRDAELHLVNATVRTVPEVEGQQLLIDATATDVLRAVERLAPATVALRVRSLPPQLRDAEVAPLAERLGTLLAGPVTLQVGDRSWVWAPAELEQLLAIRQAPGTIEATVDSDAILARVEPIAASVTREPREPKVRFEGGALRIVAPGADGASIDVPGSVALLEQALWRPERTVTLPGSVVRPQVTPENLATLGIAELIAEGKSAFPGSANYRITNIANGARLVDGVLVPPGGQFSFNDTVEPVNEANGFVPGLAIVNYRTQQEWGGGLCQVSTTVFRAAFWAGLPIDERHEHQFRIGWYEIYEPIGMDAAIFTGPGGDNLRFTNDTGNWILLQTVLDPANVTLSVQIYGTKPARQVFQDGPTIARWLPKPAKPTYVNDPALPAGTLRHTDIAQQGAELSIRRTVVQGGQVQRDDTFRTRFEPWPDIFVRGTGR